MFKHILTFSLLLIASCLLTLAQSTETRSLPSFSAIKSTASIDVVLSKGSREEVRLEVRNVSPDKVVTEVENGTLLITMKRGSYRDMQVKAYVTYRELESLALSGSGDIRCNTAIVTDAFTLSISGSGEVDLDDLNAPSIQVAISGSGDIRLGGRTDFLDAQISGSGDIHALALTAREVKARISGSGDMKVNAQESIEAWISGSGDLKYKGSPTNRMIKTSGSGDVYQIE